MLRNYLKTAWRGILKNRMASVINVCGLALGLATAVIILLWLRDLVSYDNFHTNKDNIYKIMTMHKEHGELYSGDVVPGQLAGVLRAEVPEVQYATRETFADNHLLQSGDKTFYEQGLYADPDYFKMLTFPALEGNPAEAMKDAGSIVLTEQAAMRLFGTPHAIGKTLVHNQQHQLKVAAILKNIPANSSRQFDVVLPFVIFEQDNKNWLYKWDDNRLMTWVQTKPGTDNAAFNNKINKIFIQKTADTTGSIFAYPFTRLWLHGDFRNGKPSGGRITVVQLMSAIGLFVLLIACINFMNLSTARSERRSREVGVRKVLGAARKQVIFQFLSEALLMTLLALALSILLAWMSIPFINKIAGKQLVFNLGDIQTWLLLLGIALFTAVVAGSYPAFFLSSFKPVLVLKGLTGGAKGSGRLRKVLVTFQFVISIFLIISTIVLYKQVAYSEARPIGYNQQNLLVIPARGNMLSRAELLQNALSQISGVTQVSSGSDNLVNFNGAVSSIEWAGKKPGDDFSVSVTSVSYNWINTTGLTLIEGRDFSKAYGSDTANCIINEALAKRMGLSKPYVGVKIGTQTVIGVVKDFLYNNPFNAPRPMMASLSKAGLSNILVRIQNDEHWQTTLNKIEHTVKNIEPAFPFFFYFADAEFQKRFTGIRSTGQFANAMGCMAILISCLGLFGLSAFIAERRTKEIGIRKVLGAGSVRVWYTLSREFLQPVLIAFLIAAPLAGLAMEQLLRMVEYRIFLQWWMFALAGVIAVVIALATVSYQGIKAALSNPVKALRTE
ncbi:ABC transporter permease [Deminuibacter soli]|uniref:ABC transporter permease n=1 Tax=Deminuibacter soli TaxID=2291815 RepID=A0A3E1NCP5_9BACT|nr:ABC transporter permease [Deminuibacter soli]RFM25710.1 ABC transporter permease [Deminuibacter soli]